MNGVMNGVMNYNLGDHLVKNAVECSSRERGLKNQGQTRSKRGQVNDFYINRVLLNDILYSFISIRLPLFIYLYLHGHLH